MDRLSRRDALALLYQRHYAEPVRLAFALTNDWAMAEDLAQEAFVRAWRSERNIRDPRSAPAYLRTCVVNLARRSLRRRLLERRAPPLPRLSNAQPGHGKQSHRPSSYNGTSKRSGLCAPNDRLIMVVAHLGDVMPSLKQP